MNISLRGKMLARQYKELLEYYKYRFFVPVFSKSYSTERVLSYYYETLKHYYNNIKKKLNITIQNQSSSETESYMSQSQTNLSTKEELLKDLRKEEEEDKKKHKEKLSSLVNYKTQSKALQELVCYLKLNPKFEQVKTLKTEDCFEEEKIFKETAVKKDSLKFEPYHQETVRANIKSKLFKKILEGATTQRQIPTYNAEKSRERPSSRSKSIKFIKFKETKGQKMHEKSKVKEKTQNETIFKAIELKGKESSSLRSLNKRNSSLSRINENHYQSPYHKKANSTDKNKGVTAFLTKAGRSSSTDQIKIKTIETKPKEQRTKTKDSTITAQTHIMQFPKTIPYKSTPNSPTSKKVPRPEIKVTKTDNILTIRKKKLDALKEKVTKK